MVSESSEKMLQIFIILAFKLMLWSAPHTTLGLSTNIPPDPDAMGREFLMPLLNDLNAPDLHVSKGLGYLGQIKATVYNIQMRLINPEEHVMRAHVSGNSIIVSSSNVVFEVLAEWRANWYQFFWSTEDSGTIEYLLNVATVTVEYLVERDGDSVSFSIEQCTEDMELSEPGIFSRSGYSGFYSHLVVQYDRDLIESISDKICDSLDPAKNEAVSTGLNDIIRRW